MLSEAAGLCRCSGSGSLGYLNFLCGSWCARVASQLTPLTGKPNISRWPRRISSAWFLNKPGSSSATPPAVRRLLLKPAETDPKTKPQRSDTVRGSWDLDLDLNLDLNGSLHRLKSLPDPAPVTWLRFAPITGCFHELVFLHVGGKKNCIILWLLFVKMCFKLLHFNILYSILKFYP